MAVKLQSQLESSWSFTQLFFNNIPLFNYDPGDRNKPREERVEKHEKRPVSCARSLLEGKEGSADISKPLLLEKVPKFGDFGCGPNPYTALVLQHTTPAQHPFLPEPC